MNSPTKHNDTKLLFAVAGGVTVAAAVIVFFAALSERDDARVSEMSRTPQTNVARAAPLQSRGIAEELENVETNVEFASFETEVAEPPAPAVEEPAAPAGPVFEIDPDEDFVARGLEAWHAREFDRAAAYFAAEVAERPEGSWTQYMLGLSAWKAGRPDEAVAALQKSAELDPSWIKAPINLSRVQNDRGDYEAALEAATQALAIDDQDAGALFLSARSLFNLSRSAEALEALERSIAVDDSNGYAHNLLGLIRLERGQVEEALSAFELAANREPRIAYIRNNLGMALELHGDPAGAMLAYQAATELNPGHRKARINLDRLAAVVPPGEQPVTVEEPEPADAVLVSSNEDSSSDEALPIDSDPEQGAE